MSPLTELPNIGPVLAERLKNAGIFDLTGLRAVGSKAALMLIRGTGQDTCLSMLYALEGAVQGVRWHNLDKAVKAELKEYYTARERK
ncbi:TfoX/Sxy family protein [Sporomusa termitida]|uniref:TfoX C-terminal domain-containing protein n=1 Tax=Sporomusa termitida TaxID=2377 RepID=A0A517DUW0_9FIRM|nr:TfoX/Sxy family protein [Sporomusa termitida]QDR81088.1 hypothetical protein SPTER_24440 [Sporomusa termitida]